MPYTDIGMMMMVCLQYSPFVCQSSYSLELFID